MNFRCTTGPFTVCAEPKGFAVLCQLAPRTRPLMAFLFVSSQLCLRTSFPPNLTITQLSLASTFVFIVLCTKDFHLISSCPCRAYTYSWRRRLSAPLMISIRRASHAGSTAFTSFTVPAPPCVQARPSDHGRFTALRAGPPQASLVTVQSLVVNAVVGRIHERS